MKKDELVKRSIIKKFRPLIWHKFVKAINDYELIKENDRIAVCISGGKDSFLLALCLDELKKHGKIPFELKFIVMNPGYTDDVLNKIKNNLKLLKIDAIIFESPIFEIVRKEKNPCYLCAKMRRGYLYNYAKSIGCNKIALGHHFNDAIETILLNMIYNGRYAGMRPKLKSDNFEGMELIRPLYLIKEDDIIAWKNYNELSFIDCACLVTKKKIGKRKEVKDLIKYLNQNYELADRNIFNSLSNVNLDKVNSYEINSIKKSFLSDYDK